MQVYFGHKLVQRGAYSATAQGKMPAAFIGQDMVGSVRLDGENEAWSNFYPWGVEQGTATGNDRVKFGTYTRDGEAGLDYAMNRYYNSLTGRFLSVDPYGGSADSGNPGSWNRYGYASGSPASGNDPSGLYFGGPGGFGGAGFGGGGMGDPGGAGCQINDYSTFFDSGFDPYNGANGTVCSPFGAYGLWYFNAPMPGGGGGGSQSALSAVGSALGKAAATQKIFTASELDCISGIETGQTWDPNVVASNGRVGLFQFNSTSWTYSGTSIAWGGGSNAKNPYTAAVVALALLTRDLGYGGVANPTTAAVTKAIDSFGEGDGRYGTAVMQCAKDLDAGNFSSASAALSAYAKWVAAGRP